MKKIEDYYILQFDVQTALKVSDHILDTIERLEQFPDSGSATPGTAPCINAGMDFHSKCHWFPFLVWCIYKKLNISQIPAASLRLARCIRENKTA